MFSALKSIVVAFVDLSFSGSRFCVKYDCKVPIHSASPVVTLIDLVNYISVISYFHFVLLLFCFLSLAMIHRFSFRNRRFICPEASNSGH